MLINDLIHLFGAPVFLSIHSVQSILAPPVGGFTVLLSHRRAMHLHLYRMIPLYRLPTLLAQKNLLEQSSMCALPFFHFCRLYGPTTMRLWLQDMTVSLFSIKALTKDGITYYDTTLMQENGTKPR
jgi:hypothetical protein